jgi:hypothetical protein
MVRTLFVILIILVLVWAPVILKVYSWQEGLIMTVSLIIASWLIDKYILSRKRRKESE